MSQKNVVGLLVAVAISLAMWAGIIISIIYLLAYLAQEFL